MKNNVYDKGIFTISNKTMHFFDTTVNLDNIDNMHIFEFDRHSIFYGFKKWFTGFIILLIACAIWKNLDIIFGIYCFTIFLLLAYNIYQHKRVYYGLFIQTNRREMTVRSDSKDFINKLHDTIVDAMNSKKSDVTVNLDNYDIKVNNGIINKGNKNTNKIINKGSKGGKNEHK